MNIGQEVTKEQGKVNIMKKTKKRILTLLLTVVMVAGGFGPVSLRAEEMQLEEGMVTGATVEGEIEQEASEDDFTTEDVSNDEALMEVELSEEVTDLEREVAEYPEDSVVPGEILVILEENASDAKVEKNIETTDMSVEETNDNFMLVEISEEQTIGEAIAEAETLPGVAYAQPNFVYELVSEPAVQSVMPMAGVNDPMAVDQWALDFLDMPNVWNMATGAGVRVAVLDTGVDMTHEDLQANLLKNLCYDATKKTPMVAPDSLGHGTMTTGVIAATANNGKGVVGIAYDAEVFVVDVFEGSGNNGANTYDIAEGFKYALSNGADIINMSLSRAWDGTLSDSDEVLANLIESNKNNVITVVSGGNGATGTVTDAPPYNFPSDLDACVSVTAHNQNGIYASYYSYNMYKDISAPGVYIRSTSPMEQSLADGYGRALAYDTASGTSLASPAVAAILALMKEKAPEMSNADLIKTLYDTAKDPTGRIVPNNRYSDYYGHGRVNPLGALQKLADPSIDFSTPLLTVSDVSFDAIVGETPVAKSITVKNEGPGSVHISNVTLGIGSNFVVTGGSKTMAEGAIDNTTWAVRPKKVLGEGTYTDTITFTYNSGLTATATISISVPDVLTVLTGTDVSFDTIVVGVPQPAAKNIIVKNTSLVPVNIIEVLEFPCFIHKTVPFSALL